MTIDELAREIAALDGDLALCSALKSRLQSAAPNLIAMLGRKGGAGAPFPNPATITAAQMSIFDNWIEFGGKRPGRKEPGHNRDRWKVTFDVWTQPVATLDVTSDRPAFHGVSHLWTGAEIEKRAKGTNKALKLPKVLSPAFRDDLAIMAGQLSAEQRLGLVYSPDGGYYLYHDQMIVAVEGLEGHDISRVGIQAPSGTFVFEGFTSSTSPARNCFLHSRMTTIPALAKKWSAHLMAGAT